MLGKQRQRSRHVFVLHEDAFRRVQMHRREVPDGEDAAIYQRIANALRLRSGHGDDADVDVHVAADARKLVHGQHLLAGNFAAAEVWVYVKRRNDAESICFKPAIGEQGAASAARADQHRVVGVVISKRALDGGDELVGLKAGLGFASGVAHRGKVFSNLHFV